MDTISNILHLSNMAAWESLQTTNPSMGSELLLQNAEDLGLYLATTLIGKGSQLVVSRENMGQPFNYDEKYNFNHLN